MENGYNKKLAEQAKKRRARFYAQHVNGKSCVELAKKNSISHQRMSILLKLAEQEQAALP